MTCEEALRMLSPICEHVEIGVSIVNGDWNFDLNTGMKSNCILKLESGILKAYMRYDITAIIKDIGDVYQAVSQCNYGRNMMRPGWAAIIEQEHIRLN